MRLLIVDDEDRTRELLRKHIAWNELGIHEIETARNGLAALQVYASWKPDLLLCDVRMPKMNGIEFVRKIRETDSSCEVIFLSGFSDKEYLKSAIQLKAHYYIEKPINLHEVRSVMESAVRQRQSEMRRQVDTQRLQGDHDRSLPFLRQEMVRKLISAPDSRHVLSALQSRETFLLPLTGAYTVTAAVFGNELSAAADDALYLHKEELLQELNMNAELNERCVIFGFDSRNLLIAILPGVYGSSYREQREVPEYLYQEIRRHAGQGVKVRMSVGNPVFSLAEIPQSYSNAIAAGNLQFYYADRELMFVDALGRHEPIESDWNEIRKIRGILRKGEIAEARSLIIQWSALARARRDLDIQRLKDTYFQFLLVIVEVMIQQGLTGLEEKVGQRYIWKELDRISDIESLESYVLSFLETLQLEPGEGGGGSGKMREIIRYIHAHFHEKGFTIQQIADHVHLSETYLCSFFKKQNGKTIKEFIMESRIEQAKELLADKELKLYEVASRLGFTDANYFTTFFKRYTGSTPSDYREKVGR